MSYAKRNNWFVALGIRSRLVLFFLATFGILFTLFSAGMYHHITTVHREEYDRALYNYVVEVSHSLDPYRRPAPQMLTESEMILPFSLGETLLQVRRANGEIVFKTRDLGGDALPAAHAPVTDRAVFGYITRHKRYRMVSHPFTKNGEPLLIQAAIPTTMLDRQEQGFGLFLSLSVPLALFFAGIAGYSFSRRAMDPVAAITRKANEIEAHHLSERIPVPECRDEIRELAETLNGLLDRLETAFRSQESFIADASHQLKTPLSILKGELQMFRRGLREPAALEEWLASAEQEIGYLTRIVEDLLLLAQADDGHVRRFSRRFRLDEKVMECVSRLSGLAERRQIRLSLNLDEADYEMDGEPELVRSLIENLIENAIKYSPPRSTAGITLRENDGSIVLQVNDQGNGVPTEALPYVFDRFFRADKTRNLTGGSGLGLSIVERVASLHGGSVAVRNADTGGAVFTVKLPRPAMRGLVL